MARRIISEKLRGTSLREAESALKAAGLEPVSVKAVLWYCGCSIAGAPCQRGMTVEASVKWEGELFQEGLGGTIPVPKALTLVEEAKKKLATYCYVPSSYGCETCLKALFIVILKKSTGQEGADVKEE